MKATTISYTIALLFLLLFASGCAGPVKELYPPPSDPDSAETIYVVSHGWHTGIILEKADLPDSLFPETQDFPDARYLEFGWGDEDFYQAPGFSVGLALKAIFLPTNSVLHVVGIRKPIEQYYLSQPLVRIDLSLPGFAKLSHKIDSYFARTDHDIRANPLGPGLFGNSKFFPAEGKYSAFKTCNVWTAQMLRAAGCPIVPASAISATAVISHCLRFGEVVP